MSDRETLEKLIPLLPKLSAALREFRVHLGVPPDEDAVSFADATAAIRAVLEDIERLRKRNIALEKYVEAFVVEKDLKEKAEGENARLRAALMDACHDHALTLVGTVEMAASMHARELDGYRKREARIEAALAILTDEENTEAWSDQIAHAAEALRGEKL